MTLADPRNSFTVAARFSLHSMPIEIARWTRSSGLTRTETTVAHVGRPELYSRMNLGHREI